LDGRSWWRWLALLVVPAAIVAGCARQPEPAPPSAAPEAAPADIAEQVHAFCGTACHPYPPADSFPRKYWRAEVERGFRFFERSGLPLKAPPIESVVRYYEEQAPEELPPAVGPMAGHPLPLKFEKLSYPNPPARGRP